MTSAWMWRVDQGRESKSDDEATNWETVPVVEETVAPALRWWWRRRKWGEGSRNEV